MLVAIHQPNYLPWLGYFTKIAKADVFVFLDDVQFTKGGFTNRVRILSPKGPRWLTVPVKAHLGDPINGIRPGNSQWAASHVDTLLGQYRDCPSFKSVWPDIKALLLAAPAGDLAEINMYLVRQLAEALGLRCSFRLSSEFDLQAAADDRLVEIVSLVAPGGTYLSGQGGAKYQDPEKFSANDLGFEYLGFSHPEYAQSSCFAQDGFVPGLSVVDAVFHLGWEGTAKLLAGGED